ncbi:hypothetical protein LCGC14_1751520 [marine sediment metagenome]|uniref:Uncharacterized protein n=1 Tax=marine sediment metagenome TaxID=412755 RepID=A0A0F9H3N2_9ZZZZ
MKLIIRPYGQGGNKDMVVIESSNDVWGMVHVDCFWGKEGTINRDIYNALYANGSTVELDVSLSRIIKKEPVSW